MTQVTNKGNNLYYIEGFGNYQANKELTLTELQNLVQKFENSGLINDQYDNEKTTQDLLSDTGLHDSFRKHYRLTKGQDFEGTNEDLIDEYKQYMRDYNYNLSQLSYLAVATQNYSENDKQALAHMWNVWEKYEKDDGMGGYIDIGQAFLKDPATYLNIASVGTGAIASVAARTAGKAAVKEGIKKFIDRVPAKWFVKGHDDKEYYLCENAAKNVSEETANNALHAMKNWNGFSNLKNIKNKTLIIWGDKDVSYNYEQVETLNKNIPNSELKVINGCCHNAHLEEPEKVNKIIEEFLNN